MLNAKQLSIYTSRLHHSHVKIGYVLIGALIECALMCGFQLYMTSVFIIFYVFSVVFPTTDEGPSKPIITIVLKFTSLNSHAP